MPLTAEMLTAAVLPEAQAVMRAELAAEIDAGVIAETDTDRMIEVITQAICAGLASALVNPAVVAVVDINTNAPIGRLS